MTRGEWLCVHNATTLVNPLLRVTLTVPRSLRPGWAVVSGPNGQWNVADYLPRDAHQVPIVRGFLLVSTHDGRGTRVQDVCYASTADPKDVLFYSTQGYGVRTRLPSSDFFSFIAHSRAFFVTVGGDQYCAVAYDAPAQAAKLEASEVPFASLRLLGLNCNVTVLGQTLLSRNAH